jgi:L-lactate dehydrogenase (cytochrome)
VSSRPRRRWLGPLAIVRFHRLELRATRRRLSRAVSVDDLRRIARRRLPRGVFDYVDGGAEDEITLGDNGAAFRRARFRPRVLRDVADVDPSTTLLGRRIPFPLVLAPTGFTRIVDAAGELAVARSAARMGIPYALSTLGTRSIEEVANAAPGGRLWFQVYMWRDRGLVRDLVERARRSGFEALCLTVDTAVLGKRDRDLRRGFTLPPKVGVSTLLDGLVHPGWTWRFLRSEPILFANVAGADVGDGTEAVSLADYVGRQFDPSVTWRDVAWLRTVWDGPLVLKGIQTVDDARIAADEGVDAVALSNHGGRQLDTAPPILELLPAVAGTVGERVELICDGGVRRGSDIVKAVALGATACMAGRAYLYGLGAAGEAGVDHVLELLASEMRRTMALVGSRTVKELGADLVSLSNERRGR